MGLPFSILLSYEYPQLNVDEILDEEIRSDDHVFVVLDDDPTGVQCVHDVKVYTDWSLDSLKEAFANERLFFILTNSRAMSEAETTALHKQIIERVSQAARICEKKYFFISRGDSTLRGHYPLEMNILKKGLESDYGKVDGEILFPFFKEGGRYTINDVHYVKDNNELIPCGETEFAKDKTFGYKSSNLKEYIEEKTNGEIKKEDVISISLDDLRKADYKKILNILMDVHDYQRVIVNAIDYVDVKLFTAVFYEAIRRGKVFNIRSAASFVRCVGGINEKSLLRRSEMIKKDISNGGIVVVGSHTEKTTKQLEELLKLEDTVGIEFQSSTVMYGNDTFVTEIKRCIAEEEKIIKQGKTAVVYTERELLSYENDTPEEALARSVKISKGVYLLVKGLEVEPSFVVAKGGITSADVGVKGLGIKVAKVLGQIEPGIPVWEADKGSKFPEIPYVIFPGNVGDEDTLRKAVETLINKE